MLVIAATTTTTVAGAAGAGAQTSNVAVVVAVIAATAAIVAAFVNVVFSRRAEHRRWLRDERQRAYTNLLAAARALSRTADDWVRKCKYAGHGSDKERAAAEAFDEADHAFFDSMEHMALLASKTVAERAEDFFVEAARVMFRRQQLFVEATRPKLLDELLAEADTLTKPLRRSLEELVSATRSDIGVRG